MINPALIRKQRFIFFSLLILILISIFISMSLGYSSFPIGRIIPTLFGQGTESEEFILLSIRLPRIIITLLAGMALSLSGTILQGITGNDLADPGIIGINAGAGVAVAGFFLFMPIEPGRFVYLLPAAAFVGALLTAALIYLFSYKKGLGVQPIRLILVGIGFSTALSGLMIILISSADPFKVDFISQWLAGSIWGADWPFVYALLPWIVVLVPLSLYKANRLNLLNVSEPVAIGVGVSVEKERASLMVIAVALAASAVSVTGGISFIGLIAPHMAKALVGPRHQLFMPIAVLLGGGFLLIADTIGRNILEPSGIAAGIMVALIGAPYFVYLLLKQ